ncbi:MAG: tetratricopeptide repeat protein [Pseudomonadota bacterium]
MKCIEFIPLVRLLTLTFSLVCLTTVNEVKAGERFYTMGTTSRGQISPNKDIPGQPADDSQVNLNETIRLLTRSIDSGGLEKDSLVLALNNRGIAYRLNGSYDRAIADYDRSIELKPDFAAGYSNRGLAFAKTGQYDVAIADFNQAIRLKPDDPNTYLRRGNAYYDQQVYDPAIADYSRAVALKPDFLSAYTNRYDAYFQKGLDRKAADDLKKIQELDPNFKPAPNRFQLAICGKKSCIIREEPVRPAPEPPVITPEPYQPPPPDPVQIEQQRRIQEASRLNKEGIKCDARKDYDCAIEKFEQAIRLNPNNETFKRNLRILKGKKANKIGNDYFSQGNFDLAIEFYKKSLEIYPGDPGNVTQDNLRQAREAKKRKEANIEREQKQAEARSKISDMMENLSKELGSSGSKAPLSSDTVDLTFLDPNKPIMVDPRVVKGAMAPKEAEKEREKDFKTGTETKLALVAIREKNYEKAIFYLMEARKTKPEDEDIKKSLAFVYHLKETRKGNKEPSPKATALLDAFQYGNGNWKKSMDYLKEWYKASPDNFGVRDALNFTEGLAKGLNKDTGPWEILPSPYPAQQWSRPVSELIKKGLDAVMKSDAEAAHHYFKRAHKLSPTDVGIRDTLNYTEGVCAAEQWLLSPKKSNKKMKK